MSPSKGVSEPLRVAKSVGPDRVYLRRLNPIEQRVRANPHLSHGHSRKAEENCLPHVRIAAEAFLCQQDGMNGGLQPGGRIVRYFRHVPRSDLYSSTTTQPATRCASCQCVNRYRSRPRSSLLSPDIFSELLDTRWIVAAIVKLPTIWANASSLAFGNKPRARGTRLVAYSLVAASAASSYRDCEGAIAILPLPFHCTPPSISNRPAAALYVLNCLPRGTTKKLAGFEERPIAFFSQPVDAVEHQRDR